MNRTIQRLKQKLLYKSYPIKSIDRYWKRKIGNDTKSYERHEQCKMFLNVIQKKRQSLEGKLKKF